MSSTPLRRLQTSCGAVPDKSFAPRFNDATKYGDRVRQCMCWDTTEQKHNLPRFVNLPSSDGMRPSKALSSSARARSFVKLPQNGERVPVSTFLEKNAYAMTNKEIWVKQTCILNSLGFIALTELRQITERWKRSEETVTVQRKHCWSDSLERTTVRT